MIRAPLSSNVKIYSGRGYLEYKIVVVCTIFIYILKFNVKKIFDVSFSSHSSCLLLLFPSPSEELFYRSFLERHVSELTSISDLRRLGSTFRVQCLLSLSGIVPCSNGLSPFSFQLIDPPYSRISRYRFLNRY